MFRAFIAVLASLGLLSEVAFGVSSADPDAERVSLARELVRLQKIGEIAPHVKRMIRTQDVVGNCGCEASQERKAKVDEAWHRAVEAEFDVEEFESSFVDRLAARLSVSELKEAITFANSEVGLKLTEATLATQSRYDDDATQDLAFEMSRFRLAAENLARDPRRSAAIHKIIRLTDAETFQPEMMVAISGGVLRGSNLIATAHQPKLGEPEIEALLSSYRTRITDFLTPILPASFEDMYINVSVGELEVYATHLEDVSARKTAIVINAVVVDLLKDTSLAIGEAFARHVQAENI